MRQNDINYKQYKTMKVESLKQTSKDMIFISHASEDNEFTLWIALQLAKKGYGVWCDLTKLLGGENWPREINKALRERTEKFLFVLSKISNKKDDPIAELTMAFNIMKKQNMEGLIIPLKIDDIAYADMDYRLQSIQSISFENSWAEGFAQLMKMLKRDGVNHNNRFTPKAVNEWWKNYISAKTTVRQVPENLSSNIYQILNYPDYVNKHFVSTFRMNMKSIPYPVVPYGQCLLTFSDKNELREMFKNITVYETQRIGMQDLFDGKCLASCDDGRRIVARLFNQALWKMLRAQGLQSFELAGRKSCYYFDKHILPDGKIRYTGSGELNPRIKLWGITLGENWHWAIRGWFNCEPIWHFNVQHHVLVSDNQKKIRAAPKRVFKMWNNRTYRDKLTASMYHLTGGNDNIILPLSHKQEILVDKKSIQFRSPVSFTDPTSLKKDGNENE